MEVCEVPITGILDGKLVSLPSVYDRPVLKHIASWITEQRTSIIINYIESTDSDTLCLTTNNYTTTIFVCDGRVCFSDDYSNPGHRFGQRISRTACSHDLANPDVFTQVSATIDKWLERAKDHHD